MRKPGDSQSILTLSKEHCLVVLCCNGGGSLLDLKETDFGSYTRVSTVSVGQLDLSWAIFEEYSTHFRDCIRRSQIILIATHRLAVLWPRIGPKGLETVRDSPASIVREIRSNRRDFLEVKTIGRWFIHILTDGDAILVYC